MDCMSTPNGDLAVVDTQDEMNFFIEKGFGGYDWWVGEYKIILKCFPRWFLLPVCEQRSGVSHLVIIWSLTVYINFKRQK